MKSPRFILFVFLILTCFGIQTAYSQERARSMKDGNALLAYCQVLLDIADRKRPAPLDQVQAMDDTYRLSLCSGFMQGMTNTNLYYQAYLKNTNPFFCLPEPGISNLQAARVVVKYLQDHPEKLHEEPVILAVAALRNAFPCNR